MFPRCEKVTQTRREGGTENYSKRSGVERTGQSLVLSPTDLCNYDKRPRINRTSLETVLYCIGFPLGLNCYKQNYQ